MPPKMPAKKVAYEYNISAVLSVLLSYKGTFWPLVLRTPELYLYPLLHTALVLGQFSWQQQRRTMESSTEESSGRQSLSTRPTMMVSI